MFRVQAQAFSRSRPPVNAGGFSATEPLAISATEPLAISPTLPVGDFAYTTVADFVHSTYSTVADFRKRLGISATGPPPAKRAPPVSRVALSAAQNPSPVALLQQAARMMGFFPLRAGRARGRMQPWS